MIKHAPTSATVVHVGLYGLRLPCWYGRVALYRPGRQKRTPYCVMLYTFAGAGPLRFYLFYCYFIPDIHFDFADVRVRWYHGGRSVSGNSMLVWSSSGPNKRRVWRTSIGGRPCILVR